MNDITALVLKLQEPDLNILYSVLSVIERVQAPVRGIDQGAQQSNATTVPEHQARGNVAAGALDWFGQGSCWWPRHRSNGSCRSAWFIAVPRVAHSPRSIAG